MNYIIYKDKTGEWRWYLKAANGNKIADSGEGYKNKKDCLDAIELVKGSENVEVINDEFLGSSHDQGMVK